MSLTDAANTPRTRTAELHQQVSQYYVDWRDDVYRYLLTLGLHPPQAQEVAQEVFLRLYVELRKQHEPIRNPRAWVFRVAHNLGLTTRARESNLRPFDPDIESLLPDRAPGAESGIIERERLLKIERAIGALSPQQRYCLELRAAGLRYHEIGAAIGISVSTVSEFLRRAITKLRKAVYE